MLLDLANRVFKVVLQKFPLFLQKLLQNLSFYFLIFRRMCICLWTDKIKKKEASQVLCLFITEIGAKFLPQRLAILALDKSVCSNEPGRPLVPVSQFMFQPGLLSS